MNNYLNKDGRIDDGAHLLMAILVRYPEIATIHFESDYNSIKIAFMISASIGIDNIETMKVTLFDNILALHSLERIKNASIKFYHTTYEHLTILYVVRDIDTFTINEVALIITLLKSVMNGFLISDFNDTITDEDIIEHEELIESMLESIKSQQIARDLIAIREDGRVMVFNR